MVEQKQYVLVVVSVQAGRFFPKRSKWKLAVEAKFDGEHLSTDPVEHGEHPEIGTELAWEIDKKCLRQHRLNRTPIKLQLFAIDAVQGQKELIGMVMIDLKKADQKPIQSQWYPVISCKYHNARPELKVGISLEEEPATGTVKKQPTNTTQQPNRGREAAGATSSTATESQSHNTDHPPTATTTSQSHNKTVENVDKPDDRYNNGAPRIEGGGGGDCVNSAHAQDPSPPMLHNPEIYQMIHNLIETGGGGAARRNPPQHRLQHHPTSNRGDAEGGAVGDLGDVVDTTCDLRATSEYQTALELNLWKEQQQQMFMAQLRKKEAERMCALSEEWKKRDRERESLVKEKVAINEELEGKLQKALAHVDKREKALSKNESEVQSMKVELQREFDKKNSEITDACARMEKDCLHKIEIEKEKRKFLEAEVTKLKEDLALSDKRLKDKEAEFVHFKNQLQVQPEVRLQSQLNVITLEKVELERKVDSLAKSKNHYKQEWGKALKELFKLKQYMNDQQQLQVKKQQQELQHMRLIHLAAEEKKLAKSEKDEIEDLKHEIIKLKESNGGLKNKEISPNQQNDVDDETMLDQWGERESHVTRLIEERDTLLRTGVYNSSDRIIIDLDRQIREAIAAKVA